MFRLLRHRALRTHASQLWRFALCGGTGFTLDLLSLGAFVEYGGVDERFAVILSSMVGATFVFLANKFFTFRNFERRTARQAMKFVLVYGVSIGLNALISNVFLWLGFHYLFAKIIAVAFGALWNYALSHGFIFRKHLRDGEPDVVIV